MRYTKQQPTSRKFYKVSRIGGIDRSPYAGPGSLQDGRNISPDGKPYLTTRVNRAIWHYCGEGNDQYAAGMFPLSRPVSAACSYEDGICFITEKQLFIRGHAVEGVELSEGKKQLIPMGRDLFIAPDCILISHRDDELTVTHLDHRYESGENRVQYFACDDDLEPISFYAQTQKEPEGMVPGDYWLDISGSPPVAKRYTENNEWEECVISNACLFGVGIGKNLRVGDLVEITAIPFVNKQTVTLLRVHENVITFAWPMQYVPGVPSSETVVHRKKPEIDFAVACNNRIWACRYGENSEGDFVNEVFCSAQGDPLTWQRYGTQADSCYCASLGQPGAFTGIGVLFDDVVFFKENSILCLTGREPSEYRLSANAGVGVRPGCEKSIARYGNVLLYCGVDGVYKTNGSNSVRLCDGFPPTVFENACGGVFGEKYYLAGRNGEEQTDIYTFLPGADDWYREDNRYNVHTFVPYRNALYIFGVPFRTDVLGVSIYWHSIIVTDADAPGKYNSCLIADETLESEYTYLRASYLDWFAVTNDIDCESIDRKLLKSICVSFSLGDNSVFRAELLTDSGECIPLATFTGSGQRRRWLHVRALPCHSFRLRFSGSGPCTVRDFGVEYLTVKGECGDA